MMKLRLLFVLCALGVPLCNAYHILFYHTTGTRSNLIQMQPLVEEVLNRGHKVTAILFSKFDIGHENYTEILVPNGLEKLYEGFSKYALEEGGIKPWTVKMWRTVVELWSACVEDLATLPLREEKVQKLLKTKSDHKVDLLITVFAIPGAYMADQFDCPMLIFTPVGFHTFIMEGTGNVLNWSVQPPASALNIEPLSFFERLTNHMMGNVAEKIFFRWFTKSIHHHQQGKLGQAVRNPYDIIRDRLSIILSASHPVTHGSWPYLPHFIELGGLHLRDPKPLPKDLQEFMDAAKHGVVFMSFGSQIKASGLSQEKVSVFIQAFERLKMSVIWKWDSDIPNIPKNVITRNWLPQQDLLGHPNLKVFITHGGLGSLMEAIYHKTVLVGIPLTNDQRPNILRAARHGFARMLELDTLTADDLTEAINDGFQDEEMKSAIERVHKIYVDRPERPLDTAVWWVEYVCRNGGAEIFQSWWAADTPWYQYHHLDILLFLIVIIGVVCGALVFVCHICRKLCCKRKLKTE